MVPPDLAVIVFTMKVALFTKFFLEPTHIAIAQVLQSMKDIEFHIFTKGIGKVPGFPIPNARIVGDLSRSTDVLDAVRKCDVVHAVFDGPVAFRAFEAARAAQLPFIVSFHGGYDTNAKIWKSSLRELTVTMAQEADAVTVVSKTDVSRLAALGVHRPIEEAAVAVDLSLLPLRQNVCAGRLICVGRLVPKKGFATALAALAKLPRSYSLEIIGCGPDSETLRAFAGLQGVSNRVTFLGYLPLPAMLERLAGAVALLHPACVAEDGNAEGTPQIILWAQAMGVPVIAGASGSIPDIVENGRTGWLVPPGQPQALAEAVRNLATDPATQDAVISSALNMTRERHALGSCVQHWTKRYNRVVQQFRLERSNEPLARANLPHLMLNQSPRFHEAMIEAASICGVEPSTISFFEFGGRALLCLAQSGDGAPVAIKLPLFASDSTDREFMISAEAHIAREAYVLQELASRGCVRVPRLLHLDQFNRFLVREFFPGPTLQEAVTQWNSSERQLGIQLVIDAASDIFSILHDIKPVAYIFRDWKPRNLVFDVNAPAPRLAVIDVGGIRPIMSDSDLRRKRPRAGTRNWLHLAPEMLRGEGEMDIRSDFFSLGTSLFFVLTGHMPYSNTEADVERLLVHYQMEQTRVALEWKTAAKTLVPEEITDFVLACLDPVSGNRPSSVLTT